jgi:glycosyltransferase involved in cell wall biosynthesis
MNKVLVIAPYTYLPSKSGGQKYIAQWLEALSKRVTLTVASTAANDRSLAINYNLIPLLANSIFRYGDFTLRATIRELIIRNRYDWIIWEHPYYSWLATLVKKDTGIKTLMHTHNIEYQRFRSLGKPWWPILKQYEKWGFQQTDKLSFITPQDRDFAVSHWQVPAENCLEIPYGVLQNSFPEDRAEARQIICSNHSLSDNTKILLFNGPLDYAPNFEALQVLLRKINPLLQKNKIADYTLIICGKGLPKKMKLLKEYEKENILFAGFVDNIDTYVKGADLLLNPIQKGGGVKTKVIEAIANGTPVVSTTTGAIGVDQTVTGTMLTVIEDDNWSGFAGAVMQQIETPFDKTLITPESFYKKYNWDAILDRVLPGLSN